MDSNPFRDDELAAIFDVVGSDPDRTDLEPYVAIVEELGAHDVVDLGSGTGAFAIRLAEAGRSVTAIEPGAASMRLARAKPGADRVRWILGDAADMPVAAADLVTMTGNIPEHMDDDQWSAALRAAHRALRPGGHLVFGNRDVERQTWLTSPAFAPRAAPGSENHGTRVEETPAGPVHHWLEVIERSADTLTFRWTFLRERSGDELVWETTFRVRTVDQIVRDLEAASFDLVEIRDEIFIAAR